MPAPKVPIGGSFNAFLAHLQLHPQGFHVGIVTKPIAKLESIEIANAHIAAAVKAAARYGGAKKRVAEVLAGALELLTSHIRLMHGAQSPHKAFCLLSEDCKALLLR